MKKLFFIIMLMAVSAVVFNSCKTEGCTDSDATNYSADADTDDGSCTYSGCTDPESTNYDANADTDDGSCEYEGTVAFYWDLTTSGWLDVYYNAITIYVDDYIIGSYDANTYFTSVPDCTTSGIVSVTKDLGTETSVNYSYYAISDLSDTVWNGTVTAEANTCFLIQLQY